MKSTYILIALAMVAALSMVSCKNNNKNAQSQDPTQEEVQTMKQALADSVLADIDAFAEAYNSAAANSFSFRNLELTESEKLAKPDYLLDPSVANNLVTKAQKVNALAFYCIDLGVRILYDMPTDETTEAIAKLAMEVNFPMDIDNLQEKTSLGDRMRIAYDQCKENGDVALFWAFQEAFIIETGYILAHNPELFFGKITEDQWKAFNKRLDENTKAMYKLAKYDDEMAAVLQIRDRNRVFSSDEERAKVHATLESVKQSHIANKDKFIAQRNARLQ